MSINHVHLAFQEIFAPHDALEQTVFGPKQICAKLNLFHAYTTPLSCAGLDNDCADNEMRYVPGLDKGGYKPR